MSLCNYTSLQQALNYWCWLRCIIVIMVFIFFKIILTLEKATGMSLLRVIGEEKVKQKVWTLRVGFYSDL